MWEANTKDCGPVIEMDLRQAGKDGSRMDMMAAEQHLAVMLRERGYIVGAWGRSALPPELDGDGGPIKEWWKSWPQAQSRTGRPLRLRWIPDLLVADPETHVIFAVDVKVKRMASRLDDWSDQYARWKATPDRDPDDEDVQPNVRDIETVAVELDSLWTARGFERAFALPCFLACYLTVESETQFHLLGISAHDAVRDRRLRTNDNRGKQDVAGSGSPWVYLPLCAMTSHDQWDQKLFFRGVKS